jgi:MFS family permease
MRAENHAISREFLGLSIPSRLSVAQRKSLVAGGLGWMLDAMDVMLYSMVLAQLMTELGMTKATAGFLNSLTLFSSAAGGILFGILADRIGRVRSLTASILIYSVASGACGLSTTVTQLAIFRVILGLGMGGEWGTGAALIAETWPAQHRSKALALMQSMWAIGEMIAVGATALVLPRFGWRAVFFIGVLPALVAVWVRRSVPEPELWVERADKTHVPLKVLLRPDLRRNGLIATTMNAFAMFGYWGLFTWIPAYLSLPVEQGGRGLGLMATTTWLLVMGVGKWFGYASFGVFADQLGRKRTYASYLFVASLLVPLYGMTTSASALLALGPLVAFFGTGYFSGFGTIASELFPTEVRATAMGISYNIGRVAAAAAPFIVGRLAGTYGLGPAFLLQAGAFLIAAILSLALPETKGKILD